MSDQPPDWFGRRASDQPSSGGARAGSGVAESPPPVQDRPRTGRHATAPGPRRPRRAALSSRAALIGGGIVLVIAAGTAAFLAAGGGHKPTAAVSTGPTGPAALAPTGPAALAPSASGSAPWSSSGCPSQLSSWRSTGAGGQFQAVATDSTILSQDATALDAGLSSGTAPSGELTALRSAAGSLRTGTKAAADNPIPGCVSGAHQAEGTGLADLNSAVTGYQNALSQISGGHYQAARQDMRAATVALQTGSAEMVRATADLQRYGSR